MLDVRFHPESDRPGLIEAANEYEAIWAADGERIVEALTDTLKMSYDGRFFNALVHDAPTEAFPLRFAASLARPLKQATIPHELAHRLLAEHGLDGPVGRERSDFASHVQLCLFLSDVWRRVWGDDFAEEAIRLESELRPMFRRAWQFQDTLAPRERDHRLAELQVEARRRRR